MNLPTSCFTFFAIFQFFVIISSGAQEIKIKLNSSVLLRDKERGVGFAAFKKHEHSYLIVTPICAVFVNNVKECVVLTAMHHSAFSFNFAVHPNVHGLHQCELLDTDLFNNTDKLTTNNSAYNHYSIGSLCAKNPCLNGGSCVALYTSDDYKCNCGSGLEGKNCEKDIDECVSNPCLNNGTCVNLHGSFLCNCTAEYVGNTCEMKDHCSSNPCLNHGTCVNQHGGFSCSCAVEYAGVRCETKVCKPEWTELHGKCYKVFPVAMKWNDAVSTCKAQGSHLTSVTSLEETNFLITLVKNAITDKFVWIGLNDIDQEGKYTWVDGSAFIFSSWMEGQPNDPGATENCVDFGIAGGAWYDFGCHNLERYVCKYIM
ncbi:fibropellin-3-like [Actinia tenebrosa]|uniref:Fibropellin-3-like n=1 Tax=Actinia tenebrosa TaxID=6105 RepID=A0A6P8HT00_ACTTE|nr:fibropellin-3-like [Actinia tenebrosa]